jgi:acetyl-CoA acetyltransferase
MRGRAAIVGIGHTEYSRESGRSEWQLAVEAVKAALDDAGIDAGEVDGLIRFAADGVNQAQIARSFNLPNVRYYADIPFGGMAFAAVVMQAASAIASGQASVVVVYRAMNERSGVRYGRAERSTTSAASGYVASGDATPAGAFSAPYGLLSPGQIFALWANRYAYEHGLTEADLTRALGAVAVQQREFANNNPHAMMRDRPLTFSDYENGRMISSPLRIFDYCLESDGAVAVVLVGRDRASNEHPNAAYVLSGGQTLTRDWPVVSIYGKNLLEFAPSSAIDRLYDDAGIRPNDIDVALLYEVSTFMVLSGLEVYGLARPGEAWRQVAEQGIGIDSPMPVNTHGGHLSEGYIHGMTHIVEGVRQLRGTSPNQLPKVDHVLIGGNGASTVILGREN